MSNSPSARRLAVLGSPIAHSLSPRLHAAAYRQLDLDWSYGAIDVTGDGLASFIGSRDESWLGLSLTMPLKNDVLPLLDARDELSVLTGAANTLRFAAAAGGRRLEGFNTDVAGIVRALADAGITAASQVAVLGGGATASSALVAAAQLGAEHVSVIVRTPERAEPLREIARNSGVAITILPLTVASLAIVEASLTVSTLPGGTAPLGSFERSSLPSASALLDVAYHPWPSALGSLWSASGRPVVSGLSMLVHQALIQIRIFLAGDPMIPLPDEARVLSAMFAVAGGNADDGSDRP